MNSPGFPEFRLDQWTSMRIQLLWAYRKRLDLPDSPTSQTYHFQTAALVLKGMAEVDQGKSRRVQAQAGEWLIFKQGKRWQRFTSDCELLSIGFRFQLPTGEALYDEGLPLAFPAKPHPQLEREARKVLRLTEKHIGSGFLLSNQVIDMRDYLLSQNALRTFLIELAGILHEHGVRPQTMNQEHPQVMRALEIINTAMTRDLGKGVSARSIAQEVAVSPNHLDRLMVAETGRTIFQHIDTRRLRTAQDALLADQDSIKAIAYALGFSSPAHFNSWFKKRTKTTPLQFRKKGSLA